MLSVEVAASPLSRCPKPEWLKLAHQPSSVVMGNVSEAFPARMASTEARKAGLRYEKKVREYLAEELPGIRLGLWWHWNDLMGVRKGQVDGFWLSPDRDKATILEIKSSHTSDAWWQLRKLYEPVVGAFLGPRVTVQVVEVCPFLDPMVAFPEATYRINSGELRHYCLQAPIAGIFGVHPWRG